MIVPKLTRHVCLIALIFSTQYLLGQNKPYTEVSIASPNAASLGKFTDIPVNYHTGIPQISIPVYTVKAGPLSLPIGISYHASGLKVMEPASWVGAGWALNAGGVITRTIRGAPDEAINTGVGVYGHFRNYGYSNYLTIGGNSGYPHANGIAPNDNAFANSYYDGEPDLFFFNFAGYSGKFYFNDERMPVLLPDDDLKIEYYYPADTAQSVTNQSANIQGFIITTPDGTKYYFGINASGTQSGVAPIEITFPYSANHSNVTDRVISSWYLNKIVSSDGMFNISLIYEAESYSYYSISMFPIATSTLYDGNPTNDNEYALVKNYIEGVRLKQINFPNGRIDFTPNASARTDLGSYSGPWTFTDNINTEAKALASISIADSVDFCKKYSFYYSYFSDNTTNLTGALAQYSIQTDKKRLRLDSVKEQSCDGQYINPPYKFDYIGGKVPRRLTFAQDHWGFYNAATSNPKLIPTYSVDTFYFIDGANRDPVWPDMQNGALSRITYPTGGHSAFDYEANNTWISTTRYTKTYRNSYSVGYDGNNFSYTYNVAFTNNHYMVTLSNAACPPNTSGCTASVSVMDNNDNVFASAAAEGNENDTAIFVIPAGTYKIRMFRNATQTGTGAQSNFYEIVPSNVQSNTLVGGLRIKTITQSDSVSASNDNVTTYTYDANGKSSGILYSRPRYVQIIRNDMIAQFGYGGSFPNLFPHGCLNPETGNNNQVYYISPCPVMPMNNSQGNHIGYNEVRVTQSGKGYSIYRYYGSNLWDLNQNDIAFRNVNPKECITSIPTVPAIPLPFEYSRGQLKYEGYFNESGNVVKDAFYTYAYDSSKITTHAYKVGYEGGALLGAQYDLKTYWKKQADVTENMYDNSGGSSSVTRVTYNASSFHRSPTKTVSWNSKGDSILTKNKYAFDFRINNCDTISDGWQPYLTACSSCDATMYQQIASASDLTYQLMAWRDNVVCRANARKALVTLRRNNFTNDTNNFKTCFTNAKNAANSDLKPVLELQNDNNNTVIETSNWRNTDLTSAFFYKFDYAANPVKVYINKTQALTTASLSSTFTYASNTNTALTKDSRYQDEGAYQFSSGNPSDAEGRDGVNKAYIWDYRNTVPVAVVINASANQAAFTSFEADGKGNWTFSGTPVTDATTITGSKSYSLAAGSISKSQLTSGKSYIVSYWSKNGIYTITGGTGSSVTGKTIGSWTLYEHKITTSATIITISGSGSIDEVRLYPADAQMTSYTYQPLIGITTQNDVNNRINYYRYDGMGRLAYISDQDRNVIKKFCYNYMGQPVNCDLSNIVTVTLSNTTGLSGFRATYTNTANSEQTSINIPSTGSVTLNLQAGVYNLLVNRTAGNSPYMFTTCALSTACGSTINNLTVNPGSCNTVIVSLAD